MKKLICLLMCVCTMQSTFADSDKPVSFEQLPQAARLFMKKYYPNIRIAFAKADKEWFDTSYEVMLVNGNKVEFDKHGNWKDIKCRVGSVPIAAIPVSIVEYVQKSYPDAQIIRIEKEREEYEVKLSNFWEIKFDFDFNVIDLDHDNG